MELQTRKHISHWGLTIEASVKELTDILGKPDHDSNEGKPLDGNFVWHGILMGEETDEQAFLFDVYDYNSIRPFGENEVTEWRINSDGAFSGLKVKDYLIEHLNKLRNGKD